MLSAGNQTSSMTTSSSGHDCPIMVHRCKFSSSSTFKKGITYNLVASKWRQTASIFEKETLYRHRKVWWYDCSHGPHHVTTFNQSKSISKLVRILQVYYQKVELRWEKFYTSVPYLMLGHYCQHIMIWVFWAASNCSGENGEKNKQTT